MEAFLKFLAEAAKWINRAIQVKQADRGSGHKISLIIVGVIIVLYILLMEMLEILIGPVVFFTEALEDFFGKEGYTTQEMNEIVSDAGKLAKFMRDNKDFKLTDENSFLLDRKTVIRILDAVAEYNKEVSTYSDIKYEYLEESWPLSDVDMITGESSVIEVEVEELMYVEGSNIPHKVKVKYVTERSYHNATVSLRRMDIDKDSNGLGTDIFYLNWQPILALCTMYVQENEINIGSFDEVDEELGKSYYLSDKEIKQVINIFAYKYTYYEDCPKENLFSLDFDHIFKKTAGYRLEVTESGSGQNESRTIKRIPAIAPKQIKNSYITYDYVYEPLENGYRRLKERTYTMSASKFVMACETLIHSFDAELFAEILSYLPMSQELTRYYEDVVIPKAESGEIYTVTTDDPLVCPAIGVTVSNAGNAGWGDRDEIDWDKGAMEWTGESYLLPLYPINGWNGIYVKPGEWTVKDGNSYGSYEIYEDAMKSLTVSDGFSLEEIEKIVYEYPFSNNVLTNSPLFASEQAMRDLAQCLYDFQEDYGASVCGALGIITQEGGFASAISRNGWNYLNIYAVGSQPTTSYIKSNGSTVNTPFRNYKAEYDNAGGRYETGALNALYEQLEWVCDRYWNSGQNSYYLMIWNGYNVDDPEHAYETISHSYCPPWADQAMPYSQDSYAPGYNGEPVYYWKGSNSSYKGWINGCALYRYRYYTFVRGE